MRPQVGEHRESRAIGFEWPTLRTGALLGALAAVTSGLLLSWSAPAAAHSLGADPLIQTGRLVPSDTGLGMGFTSAAMSGGVLAAGLPDATVGADRNQGAVYLFTEPAGGWSTETEQAKLVASNGQADDQFGGLVAISGDTVVVGGGTRGTALYVFTKSPRGWSGTLHEAARLTVTDPTAGGPSSLAISGSMIVGGFTGMGGYSGQHAYVFTEPAGGWSARSTRARR